MKNIEPGNVGAHPANRLIVQKTAKYDDSSVVRLLSRKIRSLLLEDGGFALLKAKIRKQTVCKALSDAACQEENIRMNRILRRNLRVDAKNVISIELYPRMGNGISFRQLVMQLFI